MRFVTLPLRLSIDSRVALLSAAVLLLTACAGPASTPTDEDRTASVVVTTSLLGAVVRELTGEEARVTVLIDNGVDPHDWSPSARDIETVMTADLVVANGLGLEEDLLDTLEEAEAEGVPIFRATDHIEVRESTEDADHAEEDEEHAGTEDEQGHEGGDPHFWVDPIAMHDVVAALAPGLVEAGIDVGERGTTVAADMEALDAEIRSTLEPIPSDARRLVTGHESMGYFADRYDLELIGAVIPGLSSQGEVSAGQLAALREAIDAAGVRAIFTEVGTPAAVVEAIAAETGVRVVELPTHLLPADGSYASFIRGIATTIADALR
jgi:zinc/manganese transport system substrate-binding protein